MRGLRAVVLQIVAASTLAGVARADEGSVTESFDDVTGIDPATSFDFTVEGGAVEIMTDAVDLGTGADGNCVVGAGTVSLDVISCSGRATGDAVIHTLAADAAAGSASLTLSAATGLAAGDEILVIELWGSSAETGRFETLTITNIAGTTVSVTPPTANAWTIAGRNVAVQRVPQYANVTILAGATLLTKAWDGLSGGVLAFRATGAVTVDGTLGGRGRGYRGGRALGAGDTFNASSAAGGGYGGEGITRRNDLRTFLALDGAGGGGDAEFCAAGHGGAGGGYGTAGSSGVSQGLECADTWFFGGTSPLTSEGGPIYGGASLDRLFLGGGGGGGGVDGDNPDPSVAGGAGGGIVFIAANSLAVGSTGQIEASGGNSGSASGESGGGGGGAGGSLLLHVRSASLGTTRVHATGGQGGTATTGNDGGGGGAGRIHVSSRSLSGTTIPAADTAPLPFNTIARVQSPNLLDGVAFVGAIERFDYEVTSLPAGSVASVQFSQDGATWFDSAGNANGANTLASGANQLSLAALGWTGSDFLYRVDFVAEAGSTPSLGSVTLAYCFDPAGTDNDDDDAFDACDPDDDADGVPDSTDNCALVGNPGQANLDVDPLGDACDADKDGDLVDAPVDCDDLDEQVSAESTWYEDADADGLGDVASSISLCSADPPAGYLATGTDNCPAVNNPAQADLDTDGAGDACDLDDDEDGIADATDNCPVLANADQLDTDANGIGNACEADADGDGWSDALDNCREVANPTQKNSDGDGAGNACDDNPASGGCGCVLSRPGDASAPTAGTGLVTLLIVALLRARRARSSSRGTTNPA